MGKFSLKRKEKGEKGPAGQTKEDEFKKDIDTDDHIIPLEELCKRYNTDLERGLTHAFAQEVLRRDGPNCLEIAKPKSRWIILLGFMCGGFSMLLWLGAILSFLGFLVTYLKTMQKEEENLYLGALLITINLVTGFFGFYQESQNNLVMEGFRKMLPKAALVIRDGKMVELPSEELVVGDLIFINAGLCIPADVRITSANVLKVDNSSITGESEAQMRTPQMSDKNPLETTNLAFYGTNVIEGSGYGIVIATGKKTLMGHIAGLTSALVSAETNIQKELRFFIKVITGWALCIGVICFFLSLWLGYDIFTAFVFCISIIVANVPEGLMVTMTASLTLTAKRMAKKRCMVKNLQAIETLGSTSVICSDKTGTLTQNRMTVSHMYYDQSIHDVLSSSYEPEGSLNMKSLFRVGVLCSKAAYHVEDFDLPAEKRRVLGDASESAVFKCMDQLLGDIEEKRKENPKLCEIPFNSTNKYQVSVHSRAGGGFVVVMKGAPERILQRCSTMIQGDKSVPIDAHRKNIEQAMLDLGYMGERVLAFADLEIGPPGYPPNYDFDSSRVNFPIDNLRFAGLMSLIDPPKDGVLEAVQKCRSAGIMVVMVTGDHPVTATAIAKKVGIISPNSITMYDIAMQKKIAVTDVSKAEKASCNAMVIAGPDLREMTVEDLEHVIANYREVVFARTSPQQKLQIVEAFQKNGNIVGVTGDGVNDSPALKKADIGISMGISGSDVSKEAADMILLDDNFATIVTGIEEGRLIFDNLKKTVGYILTSNIPEITPFLMFVFANIPQALSVMAIMVIDVGTDLWPAISLAYEKPEADIMMKGPRDPTKDNLVNLKLIFFTYLQVGVVQACAGLSSYFFIMAKNGFLLDRLIGIRAEWEDKYNNAVVDSYGQEWSYYERRCLERQGYSAYFLAIVLTQVADVIICKTRRLSIIHQGMTNWVLNLGIIFEVCLSLFVVFCPGVNFALRFEPVNLLCILPALPYALFIIVYDEFRKWMIRLKPNGWFMRHTYY